MRKGLKVAFIIGIVIFGLMFTACPIEIDSRDVPRNLTPWGNSTFSGTLTGNALGWMRAPMIVEVTFTNGTITNVVVDHNETSDHGGILIDRAIPLIIQANYFELDIITGASVIQTRNALLNSWGQIRAQLPGGSGGSGSGPGTGPGQGPVGWPPPPMNPPASGTAVGYGHGWSSYWSTIWDGYFWDLYGQHGRIAQQIRATVTMQDGFITAIEFFAPTESHDLVGPTIVWAERAAVVFNSLDFQNTIPDWVSGATGTYYGMRDSGRAAIQMIIDNWEGGN